MPNKRITVLKESGSGRNLKFKDNYSGKQMNRPEFVGAIKKGGYPRYNVRRINKLTTPVSNPDGKEANNLG